MSDGGRQDIFTKVSYIIEHDNNIYFWVSRRFTQPKPNPNGPAHSPLGIQIKFP